MIETEVIKSEALPSYDSALKFHVEPSIDILTALGEHLRNRFLKLKSMTERSRWEEDKSKAFNAYHMVPRKRALPFPGASNMASPLARIGVDSFHSNVMASLFTDGTRIKIEPEIINKDFANSSKKAADYMTYVLNHEADFYNIVDDSDKKAQMYGIGYMEPRYLIEESMETVVIKDTIRETTVDPQTGELIVKEKTQTRKEKKKKKDFDGVKIESIPVDAVRFSPFFTSLEEAVKNDVVFKDFQLSIGEIKDKTKKKDGQEYSNYVKVQVDRILPQLVNKSVGKLTALERERAARDGFYRDLITDPDMVGLEEAYLWWDVDGDQIKEEVRVVFEPDSGTVFKVSLSKCRIVELVPRPVDGRLTGDGIPKVVEQLAEEWENFHNTRSNAGQWENTTFGFYRAGGRLNMSAITIAPGRFYPVDDPREVQFAQPPRVGTSFFQEEQMILNYFERVLALDENMQGVGSSRRRSATESINVANRGSIRFGNPFNRIVNQINKLLTHVWELNQECAPAEKEYYVVGTDGAKVFNKMTRYDFTAPMKFAVSVSSVFDKQLRRDTILLAYRLYLSNPYVQQHPEILWELSQKTLNELDIDIKLPKPPEANTLSPYEEHELFKQGENPEPEPGEDYDHHYKVHLAQLNSEDIKNWDVEAQKKLVLHLDKTTILKKTLESANLNKSGMFNGAGMAKQPGLTVNRNPTQSFNTVRVGESGASAMQNNQNGMTGAMNEIMGQTVQ